MMMVKSRRRTAAQRAHHTHTQRRSRMHSSLMATQPSLCKVYVRDKSSQAAAATTTGFAKCHCHCWVCVCVCSRVYIACESDMNRNGIALFTLYNVQRVVSSSAAPLHRPNVWHFVFTMYFIDWHLPACFVVLPLYKSWITSDIDY